MLISYWGEQNKVTHRALQVQWLMSVARTINNTPIREYHRIATKSYSYIGMNEATARACQEAKLAQYTRTFVQWCNERGSIVMLESRRCVANVVMSHGDGGPWNVDIDVNEDQLQYADSVSPDIPYYMFDLSLDYDEVAPTGQMLRISEVWRTNARLYVAYQQAIDGFDRTSADFVAENSTDGGATWTDITPTSSTDGQMYFNGGAWADGLVRLRWGADVVSNVEQTPAREYLETIDLSAPYWQVVGTDGGAWRAQFAQDFPNFDQSALVVETKPNAAAAWTRIDGECDIYGDRITTPYTDRQTAFLMRIYYDGHTSHTVSNLYYFLVLDSNLDVTVESNQVTTVVLTFDNKLGEDFDATKVSVKYMDAHGTRTFSGSGVIVSDGGGDIWTATISVGNVILGTSMTCYATLVYDGTEVSTISKAVHRS